MTMNPNKESNKSTCEIHQHLFFVSSPLHLICANVLASTIMKNKCCRLFFLKPELENMISNHIWESVSFLPWPRHFPVKGLFGRHRRTLNNLKLVRESVYNAEFITLYMPVIDSEAYNYNILLAKSITGVLPEVCLIPDGLLNIRKYDQGRIREIGKLFRKLRYLISPSLNYYLFKGDRTGSDDSIVKKIYVFPNIPNEYDAKKTVSLDIVDAIQKGKVTENNIDKALIVGQPLSTNNGFDDKGIDMVSEAIYDTLNDFGISKVDYKPHPRDKNKCLFKEGYNELDLDIPLEFYLIDNPYKVVIGVYSTALLMVRLLDETCSVISIYPDLVRYKKVGMSRDILNLFEQAGVQIIYFSKRKRT